MPTSLAPADGYVSATVPHESDLSAAGKPTIDDAMYTIDEPYGAALSIIKQLRTKAKTVKFGKDYKIEYEYVKQLPEFDRVRTAYAAAATAIDVDHSEYFGRMQLWRNERNLDNFLVIATPASDALSVVKPFGVTALQNGLVGDTLQRLATIDSDGMKMVDVQYVKSEWAYNLLWGHRRTTMATDWAMLMQMYHSNTWDRLLGPDMAQFKKEEARMFLHGKIVSGTVDHSNSSYIGGAGSSATAGAPVMRGFIQDMRDNAPQDCCRDISGTMTFSLFYDILTDWAFRAHSSQLLLAIGRKMSKGMGLWKHDKVHMLSSEKVFNLILTTYEIAPGKIINTVYDSSLDVPDVGTPTRGEMMIGLDLGTDEGQEYSPQILMVHPNRVEEVTPSDGASAKIVQMKGLQSMIMPHQEAQLFVEGIQDVAA